MTGFADPAGGRPHSGVLDAVVELLADRGLPGLTSEALTARTAVPALTLRDRWPDWAILITEALLQRPLIPPTPDTGDLRGDLMALFQPWTRPLTPGERAAAALLGQPHHDPAVHSALHTAIVYPLGGALATIQQRHQ